MSLDKPELPPEMPGFFKALAEHFEKNKNTVYDEKIVCPITVEKLTVLNPKGGTRHAVGAWVQVRPVNTDKTYLGVYLGDYPLNNVCSYNPDTKEMTVSLRKNPAMFVPDLSRVVYGIESWWSEIKDESELKQITDSDIDNTWYVKALKDLSEKMASE